MMGPDATVAAGILIHWLDILGTVAFAVTGVLRGWQKKFNIVGVAFLAAAVACGGGIGRDLLRGRPVPFFLQDSLYFWLVVGTVAVMYALKYFTDVKRDRVIELSAFLEVCDAVGLGVFAVIGAHIALHNVTHETIAPFIGVLSRENPDAVSIYRLSPVSIVLFAVLTGAGGGIIRDVVAGRVPYAFSASWYAAFPALGGILFHGICMLGSGPITLWAVLIPTLLVTAVRLLYWHRCEYEREQYLSVILLRDTQGRYLMEAGKTGYMSLIGGKWQEDDGKEQDVESLRNTAVREAREELSITLDPMELQLLPMRESKDRAGRLTWRARSLRTGEMTKYHMAVFDYPKRISGDVIDRINSFRAQPVIRRDRAFRTVDPSEVKPAVSFAGPYPKLIPEEGWLADEALVRPVSLSLLKRIRKEAASKKHTDSTDLFPGLGP